MIRIAVASGKGGTGKTTVATSLALCMAHECRVHLLDCDVEAPNATLFLHPAVDTVEDVTVLVPRIDESVCTRCGECSGLCAFHGPRHDAKPRARISGTLSRLRRMRAGVPCRRDH